MPRRLIKTGLVIAALAALGGVAYGAIPSSNGTITGCVDSKGGIKVIDAEAGATCGTGKQALTWNQQGPAGPQGPQGPAGGSDAYFKSAPDKSVPGGAGSYLVGALNLPAGSYVVFAKAELSSLKATNVSCELSIPSGPLDPPTLSLGGYEHKSVSLMVATTQSQQFSAILGCSSGEDATIVHPKISAIKVGTLTNQ